MIFTHNVTYINDGMTVGEEVNDFVTTDHHHLSIKAMHCEVVSNAVYVIMLRPRYVDPLIKLNKISKFN